MVTFTRCPYCGHPEVELSAVVCPICEGELSPKLDQSMEVALGSLSDTNESIGLDDILEAPSGHDDSDVRIALELAGNAPTLAQIDLADAGGAGPKLEDSIALETNQGVSQAPGITPVNPQPPRWQASIYVYLLLIGIGMVLVLRHAPDSKPSMHASSMMAETTHARLGLEAISQGRYAAAIQFLEKATASKKNITLLPSLALAYSRTSQVERSRQVMVKYRKAMKGQPVDE